MICRNDDHGDDEDDKDENSFRMSFPFAQKLVMMTMTIAMVVMKNLMMKKIFFLGCLAVFVERRYCSVCPIIHVLATVCHCYKMIVMMTLIRMRMMMAIAL